MTRRSFIRSLLLGLICAALLGCARQELLQGLDERQANEVVAALLRNNIGAEKALQGKAGFTVRVSRADLAEAIDLVQMQALPTASRTQIATHFPADAMVSTPLGERARLLSAIEQRLEESLATLQGVQTARVHVSYDAGPVEGSLQNRKPPAMHISVLLVHASGVEEEAMLQTVRRFLRNAFVDVSYDNISVVMTPSTPPRTLAVTAAADAGGGWLSFAFPLLGLLLLAGVAALIVRHGAQGWAALRRRLRRRTPVHAPAR